MQPENTPFGNFSENLRALMNRRGLRQTQLADGTGISQASIARYLQGRVPKADELYRIARFLRLPMEELLTGTQAEPFPTVAEEPAEYGKKPEPDWKAIARHYRAIADMLDP